MSDLQDDIAIEDNAITGTLAYVSEGSLVDTWGAGHFIALKFTKNDENVKAIFVGMEPSMGSGLVELDNDMNGVFKVTSTNQKFKVVQTDGEHLSTQVFDLSGLELEAAPNTPSI